MANISGPVTINPIILPQPPSSLYRAFIISCAQKLKKYLPERPSTLTSVAQDTPPQVTIVCISDTHCLEPEIPFGDILLHAGDLSNSGSFAEIQSQLDWLNQQPHPHKIVIAGNHDKLLDDIYTDSQLDFTLERGQKREDLRWGDVIYLHNNSATITCENGRVLRVYGSPYTPQSGNWAFQYVPIRDVWSNSVPKSTDVLLCHSPPAGYLDRTGSSNHGFRHGRNCGDEFLLKEVWRVRPLLMVFGHIHEGYGKESVVFDRTKVAYDMIMRFNGGIENLLSLFWSVVVTTMKGKLGFRPDTRSTVLVNAAIKSKPQNDAIVVQI